MEPIFENLIMLTKGPVEHYTETKDWMSDYVVDEDTEIGDTVSMDTRFLAHIPRFPTKHLNMQAIEQNINNGFTSN